MGTVSLPHLPSGSGAKYTDREIIFWTKGEEAMLEAEEGILRNCRNNRARFGRLMKGAVRKLGNRHSFADTEYGKPK